MKAKRFIIQACEWLLTRCHTDHRIQPFAGSSDCDYNSFPTWAIRRLGQKSAAPPSRNSTGGFVIANRLVTQESPASVSITFRAAAHQLLDRFAAGDGEGGCVAFYDGCDPAYMAPVAP